MKQTLFHLTEAERDQLKALGHGNMTEGLRLLLRGTVPNQPNPHHERILREFREIRQALGLYEFSAHTDVLQRIHDLHQTQKCKEV